MPECDKEIFIPPKFSCAYDITRVYWPTAKSTICVWGNERIKTTDLWSLATNIISCVVVAVAKTYWLVGPTNMNFAYEIQCGHMFGLFYVQISRVFGGRSR